MMLEIPPAKDTDAEDVVWALQTSDTLWKRGERPDALVWLRRAAQAAGDANDDDRALELARRAAELADILAVQPDISVEQAPPAPPAEAPSAAPSPAEAAPPAVDAGDDGADSNGEDGLRPSTTSVLPAERVHAGMFDPWADPLAQTRATVDPHDAPTPRGSVPAAADDEVVTSLRSEDIPQALPRSEPPLAPSAGSAPSSPAPAPSAPAPSAPAPSTARPPLPPLGRPPVPRPPPLPPRVRPPLPRASSPASASSPVAAPSAPSPVAAPPASSGPSPLVLDSIEAFADLPDDAREAFAAESTLHSLAEGEEASSFALAYVVSGSFDVTATVVDAPAVRLGAGAVLRARGTTEEGVPMRLICAAHEGVVATWTDASVTAAFRTCPWVEDDLRAAADRVQTLVGITIGPLGERLDVGIREEIVSRLTMRPLAPHEVVVEAGAPVPGLLLVGIGEIELVSGDEVTGAVGSGEFLFPTEVLGAGAAPAIARAGRGGALVLFGDRAIAQELLVTCPPLLEVFAGM